MLAESVGGLKETITEFDAVVVTGMQVGCGTYVNISVLKDIEKPVYILGSFADFTGGKIDEVTRNLKEHCAVVVTDVLEIVQKLSA